MVSTKGLIMQDANCVLDLPLVTGIVGHNAVSIYCLHLRGLYFKRAELESVTSTFCSKVVGGWGTKQAVELDFASVRMLAVEWEDSTAEFMGEDYARFMEAVVNSQSWWSSVFPSNEAFTLQHAPTEQQIYCVQVPFSKGI